MEARYSTMAKFLHWTVAFLVITIVPIGLLMGRIDEGPTQNNLFFIHKSIGALILILMTLRLIYRFAHGAPSPYADLKPWERAVSETVHWTLYALLIVTPIVGLVGHSLFGAPVPFFGIFQIPVFTPKNEHLSETLFTIHSWLGWAVGVLFCLHIAGALRHFIVLHDGVLHRMLPGGEPR
jgi:cytochrome b561